MTDAPGRFVIYKGPSMNPTLKNADILHVIPYNDKKVKIGDVIIFHPPGRVRSITHRVVSIDGDKITTLGDNNSKVDQSISHSYVIGQVIYAQRGKRRLRIYGGLAGRLLAFFIRSIRSIRLHLIFPCFRPVYHSLIRTGILKKFPYIKAKTRIVSFNKPDGMELQLYIGQFMIGYKLPGKPQWRIRPPFRLFIDELALQSIDQATSCKKFHKSSESL